MVSYNWFSDSKTPEIKHLLSLPRATVRGYSKFKTIENLSDVDIKWIPYCLELLRFDSSRLFEVEIAFSEDFPFQYDEGILIRSVVPYKSAEFETIFGFSTSCSDFEKGRMVRATHVNVR